ncbi:MAG: tetratricopeptide repeat protein [Methanomicrobiales archaeon]|nr:tetratricopeptide repeat protein [Methanomicrobiales archaeon]
MTSGTITSTWNYQQRLKEAVESILHDANLSMNKGDYSVALRLYDRVIKKEPNNKAALMNKGKTYEYLGNYPAAIRAYGSLIEVDQYNPEAWYNRGLVLKKNGEYVEAMINIRMGMALYLHEK